jgi:hypothetical protein
MTDYRRFLGASSHLVLPYVGGRFVDARDRRLRVAGASDPGYIAFEVRGRTARPLGHADRPDLADLPVIRGHILDDYLVHDRGRPERFPMFDDEAPALFSPATARRWPSGLLLLDQTEFETGVEEVARRRFEEGRTLAGAKGIPSSLRATFGFAVLRRVARERSVPVSLAEALRDASAIAENGELKAREVLDRLMAERERHALMERVRFTPPETRSGGDPTERVETALRSSGATPLGVRRLDRDLLEVRYLLDGERFVSVVDGASLQVVDAGICLAGHDRLVTLDSLPSVIREAIATDQLVMTAWA